LLLEAPEAAEARVELVLLARREVLVSSFIVGDEPFSLTSLALLRDAARRGLAVRLLVDAQWNKMPAAVAAHLLAEGVEIRLYHPFTLRHPLWITRRLHDKLLVTDGEALIAGGRNVESPYFDLGRQVERRDYIDADLLVRGAAAAEARAYFLDLWESGHVRPSRPGGRGAGADRVAAAAAVLDRHWAWLEERIARERAGRAHRAVMVPALLPPEPAEVGPVRFLHDPVGRKGEAPGVGHALLGLLDGARESIVIESPYLVPSRAFRRGLDRAITRGVRVRILTNSLATTDNLWPQAGYVSERKGLVRRGVELWELTGERTLHSKAAVIDGETAIVGSFNLDPRSEHLNTELALVARDPALAAELRAWMDAHLTGEHASAVRIDRRGWPEGADGPFPGVPCAKVAKLRLLQLLTPFIRKQL
jgi:putative cardiolipin synthase